MLLFFSVQVDFDRQHFQEVKLTLFEHLWPNDQWVEIIPAAASSVWLWKQTVRYKRVVLWWQSSWVVVLGDETQEAAFFEIQLSLGPLRSVNILCAHGPPHRHSNLPFNHNRNLISCPWQRVLIACRARLLQPFFPRPTSVFRRPAANSCLLFVPLLSTFSLVLNKPS